MSGTSVDDFKAVRFFPHLSSFYAPLFDREKAVWSALDEIALFLQHCSLGIHEGDISEKAHLENPELITVSEGAVVEAFAYIRGPCWIGKGAQIRQGAYIRGNVIVGEGVVFGHGTEAKNSLFLPHSHADHFAYVGDSILGEGAHLGASVILANLRLDRNEIVIAGRETGRKKMGAIVGEGVEIGCNSVINPGSLLFPGSRVFPQVNWGGILHSGEEVCGERPRVRSIRNGDRRGA